MKILKILLAIIVVLLAVFFIVGAFLPKTYEVQRSIVINAPDSVVYKNISDFNAFTKWNPWSKMEPSAKIIVSGTPETVGHLYEWTGDKTGQGQMKILDLAPFEMVNIELKFIKPFESIADTKFLIQGEGNQSTVVWSMSGTNKNTLSKWMGLMMDGMIGKDFEDGLKFLKEKSETGN